MNIVRGKPPNFKEIVAVFPFASREGVIFTYGDTVYVNGTPVLPPQLKAHEATHIEQQTRPGNGGPETWWARYLEDPTFRLDQELRAHRAEYRTLKTLDRNGAFRALPFIAGRLASPLYGSMITLAEAKRAILK